MLLINLFFFLSFHLLPFIAFYHGLAGWPSQVNYCPIVFGRQGDTKTIDGSINRICLPLAPFLNRPVVLLWLSLRAKAGRWWLSVQLRRLTQKTAIRRQRPQGRGGRGPWRSLPWKKGRTLIEEFHLVLVVRAFIMELGPTADLSIGSVLCESPWRGLNETQQ